MSAFGVTSNPVDQSDKNSNVTAANAEPDAELKAAQARRAAILARRRRQAILEARRKSAENQSDESGASQTPAKLARPPMTPERRAAILEHRRKVAATKSLADASVALPEVTATSEPDPTGKMPNPVFVPVQTVAKIPGQRKSRSGLMFTLLVLLPTILVAGYYAFLASDQFRSEARFAVRGTTRPQLDLMALVGIPGATSQTADAYIVVNYIKSTQILRDMQTKLGLDVRTFFSKPDIDPLYRVESNMPLEEFVDHWNRVIDADFNSTTAIANFQINAFSAADANTIANAVLSVSSKLVNDLASDARNQLIASAMSEVDRTEKRMKDIRIALRDFRDKVQALDPAQIANAEQEVLTGITKDMLEMKARRTALLASVSVNSPSVRVMDRRIAALETQIRQQREQFGSGGNGSVERNLSDAAGDYAALQTELDFAEKAHMSALSALETSQAEARRQDRYFAIVVEPSMPEVALYPLRIVNTAIAFACLMVVYLLAYLGLQAIRDHSA